MCMISAIWLFGPLYNAARIIPTSRVTPEGICIHHSVFPNRFWNTFISVFSISLYFLCPLLIILALYMSIFWKLQKRITKGPFSEGNQKQTDIMNRAKTNVLKTSVFVTTCFFLCWIWNVVWFFLFSVGVPLSTNTPFYSFTFFMFNLNCCINPFCYAVQYREFQQQVRILFCKSKAQNPEEYSSRCTSNTSVAAIERTEDAL